MSEELDVVADAITEAERPPVLLDARGRRPVSRKSDWVTRGDVERMMIEMIQLERRKYDDMLQHYMRQIPGLVAHMIGDVLAAAGVELPVPAMTESAGAVAASTSNESGDTEAPVAVESPTQPDSPS